MITFQDPTISGAVLIGSTLQFSRAGSIETHALSEITAQQGGAASAAGLSCNAVSAILTIAGAQYPVAMCLTTFQDMRSLSAISAQSGGIVQRAGRGVRNTIQRVTGKSCCGG